MASVSAPPRARRARRAPSAPAPVAAPPVAPAEPPAPPVAAPPERHGKCSLILSIGGTRYRLRPAQAGPPITVVWTLRKTEGPEPVGYAVATDGRVVHCTCPDHEYNGASCKHMMALMALGLIPRPPAPPARPEPPAPKINDRIPEGWQRGGAAPPEPGPVAPSPSPAEGFRAAVRSEIRRRRGQPAPCERCGIEITPAESYHPARLICGDCFEEGGAL